LQDEIRVCLKNAETVLKLPTTQNRELYVGKCIMAEEIMRIENSFKSGEVNAVDGE